MPKKSKLSNKIDSCTIQLSERGTVKSERRDARKDASTDARAECRQWKVKSGFDLLYYYVMLIYCE